MLPNRRSDGGGCLIVLGLICASIAAVQVWGVMGWFAIAATLIVTGVLIDSNFGR